MSLGRYPDARADLAPHELGIPRGRGLGAVGAQGAPSAQAIAIPRRVDDAARGPAMDARRGSSVYPGSV